MRRFLYGFIGAVLGAALGVAMAFCLVSAAVDGDGFGTFLLMLVWGPLGVIIGFILGLVLALRVLRYVQEHQQDKQEKLRNTFLVMGLSLCIPVLVAVLVWSGNQYQYPPSDQQLLHNFNTHHVAFNELAQMKQHDKGLQSIGGNFVQPDSLKAAGVSPERVAKYRWLLNSVGVHGGLAQMDPSDVDFTVWSQGSAVSSDIDKGYAFLKVPPKQTLKSLDNCGPNSENMVKAYRHIEGCWYLYYDYLPG